MSRKDQKYTSAKAECSVYDGSIDSYILPPLHRNFLRGLDSLTDEYDIIAYTDFMSRFGTHYVQDIKMGSKFGYISNFTSDSWQKMRSDKISVGVTASVTA